MKLSKEQLKGRLRNVANKNNADARVLLRQFILQDVGDSPEVLTHWEKYRKKYKYAENISFKEVVESSKKLCSMII